MSGWAATNTLREALLSKALEYNPRGPELLDKEVAALALVEAALDAAEDAVSYWNNEDEHSLDSAMLALDEALTEAGGALRAVREGK